jgi:viologen exporter family transport system permease protein
VRRAHPVAAARLALLFLRVSVLNDVQYRINFVIQLFQSLLALATGLAVLALIFNHTNELGGWSQTQLIAVMGIFTLVGGVIRAAIEPNMQLLMEDIRQGTFDYVLTKPEDSQLLASVRQIRLWPGVDILTGAVVLVFGVARTPGSITPVDVAAFVVALVLGIVIIYCFWLLLTTGAFWVVRMDETHELFSGVYRAGQYPVGIYPGWMRLGLTFLIPIAFAVTVPSEAVTGRVSVTTLALTALFTVVMLVVSRALWRKALRRYSGASS